MNVSGWSHYGARTLPTMYMPAYGLMYHIAGVASEFMTVARLRAEMADVLARLGHDGPLYLTQRGKPRAVLLDIDEYRALIEQLEYLDDSLEALMARERRERGEETSRPLAEVIRKRRPAAPKRPAKQKAAHRAHARVSR
jgi:prevent-host-death family protein